MGDSLRGPPQQLPMTSVLPNTAIRVGLRQMDGSIAPNSLVTRPQIGNQFYVFHNGAGGPVQNPPPPSVMQVRSLAGRHMVTQSNGLPGLGTRHFSPSQPPMRPGSFPVSNSGSLQLARFMNQLIELSKTSTPVGTQSTIMRLIQQLVDSEIDCDTFNTQLKASLSRDSSMDIGPFVRDNIALLRRDLYNGVHVLPNIRPPVRDVDAPVVISSGISTAPNAASISTVPTPIVISQVRPGFTAISATESTPSTILPRPVITSGQPCLLNPGLSINSNTATTIAISTAAPTCLAPQIIAATPSRITSVSLNTQPIIQNPALLQSIIKPILPSNTSISPRSAQSLAAIRPPFRPLTPSMIAASSSVASGSNFSSTSVTVSASPVSTTSPIAQAIRIRPASSIITPTSSHSAGFARTALFGNVTRANLYSSMPASTVTTAASVAVLTQSSTATISSLNQPFFPVSQLKAHLAEHISNANVTINDEAFSCLAHGLETFLRTVLTRLSIVVGHKSLRLSDDPHLSQTDYVRDQLAYLQRLEEHDKHKKSELEMELILKTAKSRLRNENPEQQRMRDRARRQINENNERERQRQANQTALSAIGDLRKPKPPDPEGLPAPGRIVTLVGDSSASGRTSLVSASRLRLVSSAAPVVGGNGSFSYAGCTGQIQGRSALASSISGFGAGARHVTASGCSGTMLPSTSSFNLAASLRARRATLRDLQIVLGKDNRLCRSRTFFKSYWR